jgi:3-methylcrotonyl-CoA carboxylase alpha subunit/geranyl-CoA carboxylase alpha subunit
MLGKLVAHGATREEAIARLVAALDATQLLGLPTNRRFLAACLAHEDFARGRAGIAFLERNADALRTRLREEEEAVLRPAALAAFFPDGPSVSLALDAERPLRVRHRGRVHDLRVRESDVSREEPARAVRLADARWHAQCAGVDLFIEDASFDPPASASASRAADELRAPFNGKVIAVKVEPGAEVARGQTLVVLESMKLEHALAAARDGVVRSVHMEPGQQAATSQLLVTLEPQP